MAENSFRILIDFRELNIKSYKFAWMSVSKSEIITIQDLKDVIFQKFSLKRSDIQLYLLDGYLPEDERVDYILRDNDVVRLLYASPTSFQTNSCILNLISIDENDSEQIKTSKKRKHGNSIELPEVIQTKHKQKKHRLSDVILLTENNVAEKNFDENNVKNDNEHSFSTKKKKYKDKSQKKSLVENDLILDHEIITISEENHTSSQQGKEKTEKGLPKKCVGSDDCNMTKISCPSLSASNKNSTNKKPNYQMVLSKDENCKSMDLSSNSEIHETFTNFLPMQGNNCKKKKRKRHKKRKPLNNSSLILPNELTNTCSNSATTFNQVIDISTKNPQIAESMNLFKTLNAYSNFPTIFNQEATLSNEKQIMERSPQNSNVSNRIVYSANDSISAKVLDEFNFKTSTPVIKSQNLHSTNFPHENPEPLNISFNQPHMSREGLNISTTQCGLQKKKCEAKPSLNPGSPYYNWKPVNILPKEGTHIAYKILELDETYSPVISQYKKGVVKSIDIKTDELVIKLIEPEIKKASVVFHSVSGLKIKAQISRTGKFEIVYSEDELPEEIIKTVTVSWPSLIDPVQKPLP
ncbi:coilin [Caerostris extrusa]|uniref:Coilin n=1 Tax=Caerostris extrusa TaxID=172846 RepID=A0AAV4TE25_CAEEX|nr:coilin [Caerostris extrusa]